MVIAGQDIVFILKIVATYPSYRIFFIDYSMMATFEFFSCVLTDQYSLDFQAILSMQVTTLLHSIPPDIVGPCSNQH
jgi:hypothetical protein